MHLPWLQLPQLGLLLVMLTLEDCTATLLGDCFTAQETEAHVQGAFDILSTPDIGVQHKNHALYLLSALGRREQAAGHKSNACRGVQTALHSRDALEIFHGLRVNAEFGCGASVGSGVGETAAALLQRGEPGSLYLGVAMHQLAGLGLDTDAVVDKAVALVDDDGSVRASATADEATDGLGTRLLAEVLVLLHESAGQLRKDQITATANRLQRLLAKPRDTQQAALLGPLSELLGRDGVRPSADELGVIAGLLQAGRHGASMDTLAAIYRALGAVAERAGDSISCVQLSQGTIGFSRLAKGELDLQVTDLLGNPAGSGASVGGTLRPSSGGQSTGLSLSDQGSGRWGVSAGGVAPGRYTVRLELESPGEQGGAGSLRLPLVVTTQASVQGISVAVSKGKAAGPRDTYEVAPGRPLPPGVAASQPERLQVSFEVDMDGSGDAQPHQVAVRFLHTPSGTAAFSWAKPAASGRGYAAQVALGEEAQLFKSQSGPYEVSVLVGDFTLDPAVEVPLGQINLTFQQAPPQEWPLYSRALLHDSDVTLTPLPEKHHTFRLPERRPMKALSLVFTVVVLAPLGLLAWGLLRTGANLRRIPRDGLDRVWCFAYQGFIGCVLALFVAYWLHGTMDNTLKLLAPLGAAIYFTGKRAMAGLAQTSRHTKAKAE